MIVCADCGKENNAADLFNPENGQIAVDNKGICDRCWHIREAKNDLSCASKCESPWHGKFDNQGNEIKKCQCIACDCNENATTTDDSGIPVCEECAQYVIDNDGEVHCSRSDDLEPNGNNGWRLPPPDMPDENPKGEWSLWWETVGDDAHLVARFSSRDEANQAVEATDWPPPGDNTPYLCGYGVRKLVNGKWIEVDDDE